MSTVTALRSPSSKQFEYDRERVSCKALLVDFSTSKWRARKKDGKVSKETRERYNASSKAGNFQKNLLPFQAESFEALNSALREAREFHIANTTRFSETSDLRVLATGNYDTYTEGIRERQNKLEPLRETFFQDYAQLVDRAKDELGDMFNEKDYPPVATMQSKFTIRYDLLPYPLSKNVDVDLDDVKVEEIRASIEETVDEAHRASLEEMWERLHESLSHIADILSSGKRVHQTIFDNVKELCDLLPRLNASGDEDLNRKAEEIKAKLGSVTKNFVKDKTVRKKVAKDAANLAKDVAKKGGLKV